MTPRIACLVLLGLAPVRADDPSKPLLPAEAVWVVVGRQNDSRGPVM